MQDNRGEDVLQIACSPSNAHVLMWVDHKA